MTRRLVVKELRENAVWALIALIVAMVVIFLRRAPDLVGPLGPAVLRRPLYYLTQYLVVGPNRIVLPLLWPTGLVALFCALWGMALGLAQTLPDRLRGTDQVLFALPVTRVRLFAAKVSTGIALYLLTIGIPFALLALRAATPGHYPSPFRWWMIGPGLAAIAVGLCAYAGAMVTVLRPARWYVSRAAPLIGAGGICLFTYGFAFFGAAAALMGTLLLLWAAAVCIHTPGARSERSRARLGRLRLPVVLAVFIGWSFCLGVVLYALAPALRTSTVYWFLRFSPGGELTVVRHKLDSQAYELYDSDMQFQRFESRAEWPEEHLRLGWMHRDRARPEARGFWRWHEPDLYVSQPACTPFREDSEKPTSAVLWYWLSDKRYFAAYDAYTCRRAGALGREGFQEHGDAPPLSERPFPVIRQTWTVFRTTWVVVPSRSGAHLLHLSERTVTPLTVEGAENAVIVAEPTYSGRIKPPGPEARVYVKTDARVECYDFGGTRKGSFGLTDTERRAKLLGVGRAEDGTFIVAARGGMQSIDGATVRWLTASGETAKQVELRRPAGLGPRLPARVQVAWALLQPLPWLAWGTAGWTGWWPFELTRLTVMAALLVGVVCALVVGLHAWRSFVAPWQIALWCALTFGCGVAALLAYFTTRSRPAWERCRFCGRKKPAALLTCPACHEKISTPPRKGTEIFD